MTRKEQLDWIAAKAIDLVGGLPPDLADNLVRMMQTADPGDWPASRMKIIQSVSNPNYRNKIVKFLDRWQGCAGDISAEEVAIALHTAVRADRKFRNQQTLDFVWTGPDVGIFPVRQTQQALIQLIDSAEQRILIVSYAVFNIPNVAAALIRAVERKVRVRVVVEAPHLNEGMGSYDTLKALGPAVSERSEIFLWPLSERKTGSNGKHGILHVKCAVADGRSLFLSSANLTEYAFTINMELGLLVNGGDLPRKVEEQFSQMIRSRILQPLSEENSQR